MSRSTYSAVLILVASTAASAADLLPLKRGIYVDVHRACKGASNADTLSYWGRDNGINAAKVTCRIKAITKTGTGLSLQRTCRSIQFEGSLEDEVRVTILGPTSFVMGGGYRLGVPDRTFRYCGKKVQF
jgi:hypothetical protein